MLGLRAGDPGSRVVSEMTPEADTDPDDEQVREAAEHADRSVQERREKTRRSSQADAAEDDGDADALEVEADQHGRAADEQEHEAEQTAREADST